MLWWRGDGQTQGGFDVGAMVSDQVLITVLATVTNLVLFLAAVLAVFRALVRNRL